MARVRIEGDTLIVDITGLDKLWALKSRLAFPLAAVRGVTADPKIVHEYKGLRAAGTQLPGVITAGTFHHHGERVFWDVHHPAKAVVIELDGQHYARLVLQVDDPRATVAAIEAALRK